ncbi:MAG: AraC family transcriptional regulator [Leptolyngbya sp. SIO1E4]|nr:AraC family transcriptional regulator [Leptolyngbya sp. SIO1E4]
MSHRFNQRTKFCLLPEFDNLELFRARSIHYHYARHAHPSYAIGIIEAGVGGNRYRGATYLAPPRSVVFMNPEEPHTGYSAEELPLTYRMLYPSMGLIHQITCEMKIRGVPFFKDAVVQNETLASSVLLLHTVLEESQNRLARQSLLTEVLSEILLHYADTQEASIPLQPEHQAVRLVKEYLHDNFRSNISLDQLAEITHLNGSYLIRVFRHAVGMPPYSYLTQIRIRKAKQLLTGGMSIAEVAIAVGMADQSHLSRHFKRIMGITPGYYREMSTSFKTD